MFNVKFLSFFLSQQLAEVEDDLKVSCSLLDSDGLLLGFVKSRLEKIPLSTLWYCLLLSPHRVHLDGKSTYRIIISTNKHAHFLLGIHPYGRLKFNYVCF